MTETQFASPELVLKKFPSWLACLWLPAFLNFFYMALASMISVSVLPSPWRMRFIVFAIHFRRGISPESIITCSISFSDWNLSGVVSIGFAVAFRCWPRGGLDLPSQSLVVDAYRGNLRYSEVFDRSSPRYSAAGGSRPRESDVPSWMSAGRVSRAAFIRLVNCLN